MADLERVKVVTSNRAMELPVVCLCAKALEVAKNGGFINCDCGRSIRKDEDDGILYIAGSGYRGDCVTLRNLAT